MFLGSVWYLWGDMAIELGMQSRAMKTISQLIFPDWKRGPLSVMVMTSDLDE